MTSKPSQTNHPSGPRLDCEQCCHAKMPPKKVPSKSTQKNSKGAKVASDQNTSVVTCPICSELVRDLDGEVAGHDGLFCDGECQSWLHRWCAGVMRQSYSALAASDDPFLCPACTMASCQTVIATQLADISSLRQSIRGSL